MLPHELREDAGIVGGLHRLRAAVGLFVMLALPSPAA